ncbi:MAG: hypothetical protein K4H23_02240 [Mollicutes bacterium PWAP]|nr:hypothetical protein [Mollicutes bacterium PWAP]
MIQKLKKEISLKKNEKQVETKKMNFKENSIQEIMLKEIQFERNSLEQKISNMKDWFKISILEGMNETKAKKYSNKNIQKYKKNLSIVNEYEKYDMNLAKEKDLLILNYFEKNKSLAKNNDKKSKKIIFKNNKSIKKISKKNKILITLDIKRKKKMKNTILLLGLTILLIACFLVFLDSTDVIRTIN